MYINKHNEEITCNATHPQLVTTQRRVLFGVRGLKAIPTVNGDAESIDGLPPRPRQLELAGAGLPGGPTSLVGSSSCSESLDGFSRWTDVLFQRYCVSRLP